MHLAIKMSANALSPEKIFWIIISIFLYQDPETNTQIIN